MSNLLRLLRSFLVGPRFSFVHPSVFSFVFFFICVVVFLHLLMAAIVHVSHVFNKHFSYCEIHPVDFAYSVVAFQILSVTLWLVNSCSKILCFDGECWKKNLQAVCCQALSIFVSYRWCRTHQTVPDHLCFG